MTVNRLFAVCCSLTFLCCSELTTVDAPDVVEPDQLANASGATARYAGALTLFHGTYGSGDASVIVGAGLVADEFTNTGPATISVARDTRVMPEATGNGGGTTHQALSRARVNALAAIHALRSSAPEPRSRVGQLFAVVGYTEIFFGEHFCAGLPLANVTAGRPSGSESYGAPLTQEQMFERAWADFDSAEAQAGGDVRIINLARVGRARALLNLGRFNEAAASVGGVPTNFVFTTEHSATINPNALAQILFLSISNNEGTNGLNFRTAADPRLTVAPGSGVRAGQFIWTKMASAATPLTLASGTEARLIEAEASLRAGDATSWLNRHNALRATVQGLGPLVDPGTASERHSLHFRERAFWLFGQGQRLADLRRLVRQYARTVESVFPTGTYGGTGGGTYGTDVTMTPLPTQMVNPNYTGCVNRNP